jgi:integrase
LSSDVGEALKTHFSISANRNPEALLFATRNGDPLASNNLRNRGFRSACERAGLPKLSWHSLRHTHGTVQGTPLKLAQAQLGHSDLATTLEVYTHASAIAQREAVNSLRTNCSQVFPSVPKKAVESGRKEEAVSPIN